MHNAISSVCKKKSWALLMFYKLDDIVSNKKKTISESYSELLQMNVISSYLFSANADCWKMLVNLQTLWTLAKHC